MLFIIQSSFSLCWSLSRHPFVSEGMQTMHLFIRPLSSIDPKCDAIMNLMSNDNMQWLENFLVSLFLLLKILLRYLLSSCTFLKISSTLLKQLVLTCKNKVIQTQNVLISLKIKWPQEPAISGGLNFWKYVIY